MVFEEAATSGCLPAATRNGEVVGYALFALRSRRFEVSLTHLCVRNSERGQGTARRLVDDIARRHADRRGIRLRCRFDYPAHHMWPRLGFEHWSRRLGRSHAGHELATWWRPLADLSLFDSVVQLPEAETADDRFVAALETNIVLDLLEGRNRDASLGLAADWMHDHAQLVVTAQVSSELRSGKGIAETARPSTGRPEFNELRPYDDAVNESYTSLRTADELSTNQDDSSTAFEPEFIKTSELAVRRSASLPTVDVLARFTNQAQSERAWSLREQLARTISHPEGRRIAAGDRMR